MDALQSHEREQRERVLTFPASRRLRYEWRVEQEAVLARLQVRPGERVLDAGCGIGRMSHALQRAGAEVIALDFALARLQYLRSHAPVAREAAALIQADVTRIPLRPGSLDAIVCMQVLEHLPTERVRRQLLASFARLLRPGGRLLLTVYNYPEPWRRRGVPIEGLHASGIFYHAYRAPELRAELTGFEVVQVCGIVNLLPHTYRLFPLLGPVGRALDHQTEPHSRRSLKWGHLLLAHARLS